MDAEDAEKALHNGAAVEGAGGDGPDIAQACQVSNLSIGFCTLLEAAPIVKDGKCCFAVRHGSCCGRPFVVGGVPRQGQVIQRGDWCGENRRSAVDTLSAEARAELASAWLGDALLEHASIASFARFSLELLALGAPAALVEAAQRASLDETRHALRCFALASRFSERDLGPGRLAMDGLELERSLPDLAVAVLREGGIGETLAAALALRQLESAVDEQCREALAVIAADEAEHSLLAWRFLRYAIERGGSDVVERLRDALATAPRHPTPRRQNLPESTLNHYGRLTPEQERDVIEEAWREVIAPAAAMLLTPTKPSDVLALS